MAAPFVMTTAMVLEALQYYNVDTHHKKIFSNEDIIDFRNVRDGEFWINKYGDVAGPNNGDDSPRNCYKVFILKCSRRVVVDLKFIALDADRAPLAGDWYRDEFGHMLRAYQNMTTKYPVYTCVTTERKVIQESKT